MFPRLDVDFHLAPFVDSRDHVGVAAARVTIGAPHFEREREFWVRPVRWVNSAYHINMLLRPVEAESNRLLLGTFAFRIDDTTKKLQIPERWKDKARNQTKLFSSLARFWCEAETDVRIGWTATENPTLYLPDEYSVYNRWQTLAFEETHRFSLDEFAELTTTELHHFLQQQRNNQTSQLYLTWRWGLLTREQQWNRFFAGPIWKDYPKLLQNIIQSQAFYTPEIATGGARVNFCSGARWMHIINTSSLVIPLPERSRKWERILYEYYGAQKTESCVPAHIDFQSLNVLRVHCPAPTHHEMLEARLTLHAWARENLPPSRADELLALDALN